MLISHVLSGALAGLVATGPMTAAMQLMQQFVPFWKRRRLPPEEITAKLAEHRLLGKRLPKPAHLTLTWLSHLGYGAAAGSIYAPLAHKVPLPPVVKGVIFGLLVWLVSYLGWLPALGVMRPATQQPTSRNTLMIIAHIVWGGLMGMLAERFYQAKPKESVAETNALATSEVSQEIGEVR